MTIERGVDPSYRIEKALDVAKLSKSDVRIFYGKDNEWFDSVIKNIRL
ncbi:hypothetical protein [Paraferrimonas haliotis]|nr:hypothetical protein [Paraferrimonas haliotis]